MHERFQNFVDPSLVAAAERPEKAENIGIQTKADGQLGLTHVKCQISCPSTCRYVLLAGCCARRFRGGRRLLLGTAGLC
jgi:hypothetical protein